MRDASEYRGKAAEFAKLAAKTSHSQLRSLYTQLAREYTELADAADRIKAKLEAITAPQTVKPYYDRDNQ